MEDIERKSNQDKFYAQRIGKEIYVTSRRQIVKDEYFLRGGNIHRYNGVGSDNSNPIIGTTDLYFGYNDIGKNEDGKTIGNQIGGGDGVLVNAPMVSGVPRALREVLERGERIYEVKVEYLERNSNIIKTVTLINQ